MKEGRRYSGIIIPRKDGKICKVCLTLRIVVVVGLGIWWWFENFV